MKIRILTILITISMLLLLIASCDSANNTNNSETVSDSKTEQTLANTSEIDKTETSIDNTEPVIEKTEQTLANTSEIDKTETSIDNTEPVIEKTEETLANTSEIDKTETSIDNTEPVIEKTEETKREEDEVFTTPIMDGMALDIRDYDDYLSFSQGVFDEQQYPSAELIYNMFDDHEKSLIDIRGVLDLPNVPTDGSEQILINEPNTTEYSVYSRNEKGTLVRSYIVRTTYSPSKITSYPKTITEAPTLESLKDRTDDMILFKIQSGNHWIVYTWLNQKPFSVNIYSDHHLIYLSIGSAAEGLGVEVESVDDIKEICGELIASLFSENTEDIKAAVETIKSRLPQ